MGSLVTETEVLATREVACAIPAFEAAPSIGDVVTRALKVLPTVLVVDDGSTDGTAAVAKAAGAEVIRLPRNEGKGRALETAFAALFARGYKAVVTVDADGQHLPEEIPVLIEEAQSGADMVLGCRAQLFDEMSGVRRWSNRLSSHAISVLAGRSVPDVQTGFRLYREALVRTIGFPEPRFEAESAVIVRACRRSFRIDAVPVRLGFADGRTTSHYRPVLDSLRIARAVVLARLGQ